GKPIPPRPTRFSRLTDREVELHAAWVLCEETERIGDWLLRWSPKEDSRSSSVVAVGDPGAPTEEALARVRSFYASRNARPQARVVTGSQIHQELQARGWHTIDPEDPDTQVSLAGVAS